MWVAVVLGALVACLVAVAGYAWGYYGPLPELRGTDGSRGCRCPGCHCNYDCEGDC